MQQAVALLPATSTHWLGCEICCLVRHPILHGSQQSRRLHDQQHQQHHHQTPSTTQQSLCHRYGEVRRSMDDMVISRCEVISVISATVAAAVKSKERKMLDNPQSHAIMQYGQPPGRASKKESETTADRSSLISREVPTTISYHVRLITHYYYCTRFMIAYL